MDSGWKIIYNYKKYSAFVFNIEQYFCLQLETL